MTPLLWLLFSSTGVLIVLASGAVWLIARPASRRARSFVVISIAFYTTTSVYGVSYLFERALAAGYHPIAAADVPPGRTAIVVLGSGSFTARDWARGEYTTVDNAAAERVLEAARVYRLIGPEWVISSGGRTHADDPDEPTAVAMRKALIALGVPPGRILEEVISKNTRDEAVVLKPVLKQLGAEHVVLVTSARHMRRSVGTFRAAGVDVIPAIARNSFLDENWIAWWLPSDVGLWEMGAVAHEVFGIGGYLLRGEFQLR